MAESDVMTSRESMARDPEVTTTNHESERTVARGRIIDPEPRPRSRVIARGPWSWAGVLALGVGLLFTVMGLVGVARAGLEAPLSSPVVTVGWLQQTAWLSLGHVLLGVVLASVGAAAGRDRASLLSIAGALLVSGLVLLIEPGAFAEVFGTTARHGVTYVVAGSVLLLLGFLSPTVHPRSRVVTDVR